MSRKGYELNLVKIASVYSKSKNNSNYNRNQFTQNLINNSNILYIDENKKRTDNWLSHNRLQLPLGITKYGSVGTITLKHKDVNDNYSSENEDKFVKGYKVELEKIGAPNDYEGSPMYKAAQKRRDNVQFSDRNSPESKSIKEQIKEKATELNNMSVVANINIPPFFLFIFKAVNKCFIEI